METIVAATDKIAEITYYTHQLARLFETCAWTGEERRVQRDSIKAFGKTDSMAVEKIPPTLTKLFTELARDNADIPENDQRLLRDAMLRLQNSCDTVRGGAATTMPRSCEVAFYLVDGFLRQWEKDFSYGH